MTHPDEGPETAEWVAAYRERARLVGAPRLEPRPRTIANVREASVTARFLVLGGGVLVSCALVILFVYLISGASK